jgi:hypothetical protein
MVRVSALLRMTAGLTHWAVAFCVLYGLHGIGCAGGWAAVAIGPVSVQRLALLLAWIGGIFAGVALTLWLYRTRGDASTDQIGVVLGWIGVAAIVVTGLPIVTLPACL